ncbi:hypothetical protein KJ359_003783 [Pestalotiopsis sp. 9143b]|nr:hypothetical protein KJ359_003783 [Pestalotiopsis sp. 9143b]
MSPVIPAEILCQIFDLVDQKTVINCRLISRHVLPIATAFAFRHMRLEAAYEVDNFISVATSHLRHHVHEITVDTWVGPDFKYHTNDNFWMPRNFWRALSYLRFFKEMKTLNLRFNKWCGADSYRASISIEEDYDFRFVVLDIVFQCLTGTWSSERQAEQEHYLVMRLEGDNGTFPTIPEGHITASGSNDPGPIEISTLTISNLADFNDERLTTSEAFKQVMTSDALTDLKLFVTTEEDTASPESSIMFREKYDFFETMPQTWLCPSVAQNLQVLSLFFRDYWGWNPKMDFRTINPANGLKTGLPNLRVLALGNYVFSHHWQIEWIESVGELNGHGGLQELYLDDCPVMWQARAPAPLDDSKTVIELPAGGSLYLSNAGYPRKGVMRSVPDWRNTEKFTYDLRWHQILNHWREHMSSLKVFCMGHGSWFAEAVDLTLMVPSSPQDMERVPELRLRRDSGWRQQLEDIRKKYEYRKQPVMDRVHLNYACPSPSDMLDGENEDLSRYRNGVGLAHERQHILQYIHFDIGLGPTQWIERDNSRAWFEEGNMEAYEHARKEDEASYEALQAAVSQRT